MSSLLYSLGLFVVRRRLRVLGVWLLLAVVLFGLAGVTGGTLVDSFTVPGTESQRGIDTLAQRFPEASGTTGQIVFGSTSGSISSHKSAVEDRVKAVEKVKHVTSVDDPFASDAVGTISPDGRYALVQVQFDVSVTALPASTVPAVEKAAAAPPGSGFTSTLGGAMYTSTGGAGISITELIGVGIALLVLAVTFSSLVAAGLPLLTAALGVGATLAGVLTVAAFATVSSTTPTLALMIGLAVGIDYGLFIVTRHRRQLSGGMEVRESIAEALATAGSAVVFAGMTVIIALCGLAVANIPFLTVMGAAAAAGVAVAVLVALTLLPAVLSLIGEHLRPKPKSHATRVLAATAEHRTMGARWVALITKVPALTVILVLAGIGVLAYPVKDLALSLPDNGSSDIGTPERTTYDLVSKEFGPGYNAPLLVTADVITNTDPRGAVDKLADDLKTMPGVAAITKQTPNPTGDLGLVRLVPDWGQSDPRTGALVTQIRARAPELEKQLDVHDVLVTGQTAVTIDVSDRLAGALVPFGSVIIGLSLVLLAIVFRSVAVPLKATIGYLFSIAAALGAVTAVFVWGWLAGPLHVTLVGPVVSFMPIIVMGVLFGLAMDYEVFLVSQMREDYVRGHTPSHAVTTGFTGSARVVTAAAIIMISVFAAFIPDGSSTIKPIALGLAVGVTVDAFLVRMTLVPAVLALLGRHAWWIPRWLDRALPSVDVEGHAMVVRAEQAAWEQTHGTVAVRAERLVVPTTAGHDELDLQVAPGACTSVPHPDPVARSALAWTLAGRLTPVADHLAVLGHVLPDEAIAVRQQVRVATAPDPDEDDVTVDRHLAALVRLQTRRRGHRRAATTRARQQAETWLREAGAPVRPLREQRLGGLDPLARRLVGLAGTTATEPRLLVVDDADAGLDPAQSEALAAVCERFCALGGTTAVLVRRHVAAAPDALPVAAAHHVQPAPPPGRPAGSAEPEPAGDPAPARVAVLEREDEPGSGDGPEPEDANEPEERPARRRLTVPDLPADDDARSVADGAPTRTDELTEEVSR